MYLLHGERKSWFLTFLPKFRSKFPCYCADIVCVFFCGLNIVCAQLYTLSEVQSKARRKMVLCCWVVPALSCFELSLGLAVISTVLQNCASDGQNTGEDTTGGKKWGSPGGRIPLRALKDPSRQGIACIPDTGERYGCCWWWVWGVTSPLGVPLGGWVIAALSILITRACASGASSPSVTLESCSRHGLTLPGLLCGGHQWLCQHARSHLRSTRQGWGLLSPSALQLLPHKWWPSGQLWLVLWHATASGHGNWSHPVYFTSQPPHAASQDLGMIWVKLQVNSGNLLFFFLSPGPFPSDSSAFNGAAFNSFHR